MTLKEYAQRKAKELTECPTELKVEKVANEIRGLTVDNQSINESQIEMILSYMQQDIGDVSVINESFDNKETISLMNELRKLIAQSNSGK